MEHWKVEWFGTYFGDNSSIRGDHYVNGYEKLLQNLRDEVVSDRAPEPVKVIITYVGKTGDE